MCCLLCSSCLWLPIAANTLVHRRDKLSVSVAECATLVMNMSGLRTNGLALALDAFQVPHKSNGWPALVGVAGGKVSNLLPASLTRTSW